MSRRVGAFDDDSVCAFEALKGTILYKGDILGNLYLHLASYFNI